MPIYSKKYQNVEIYKSILPFKMWILSRFSAQLVKDP